jgi:2-phosphosulfolactate phosphatase
MKARVRFTLPEVDPAELAGSTAIVVDVIRATSSICAALRSGARAIYPTASTEEALRLAQSLGREDTLLCGERRGTRIEGFDLGNSPREFTSEAVADKRLVMNTTNGTRAFLAAEPAERVFAASLMNVRAVADVVGGHDDLVILCAGREDAFALEDAYCAGALLRALGAGEKDDLDDSARAALALADRFVPNARFLAETAGGRALLDIDMGADLEWCARRDVIEIVPEMKDRAITPVEG